MSIRNKKGIITLMRYNAKFGDLQGGTFEEDKTITDAEKDALIEEMIDLALNPDDDHQWSKTTVLINETGLRLLTELKDEQLRGTLVLK